MRPTCATKDLKHVEDSQVNVRTVFCVVDFSSFDNHCVLGDPNQSCSARKYYNDTYNQIYNYKGWHANVSKSILSLKFVLRLYGNFTQSVLDELKVCFNLYHFKLSISSKAHESYILGINFENVKVKN